MGRFSHRNSYKDLPPQLKLETISEEFRTHVLLAFQRLMISFRTYNAMGQAYINTKGKQFFQDLWVKELRQTQEMVYNLRNLEGVITGLISSEFHELFDLIEFADEFSKDHRFQQEITEAFISERLAYRFKDGEVIAVGTEEQAKTLERASNHLEKMGADSATSHLHKASRLLAQGEFGDSVRESIHAVESIARRIEPSAKSLGAALNLINKDEETKIHPALNEAFKKIYGYTSDEQGIRHPLIDKDIAPVTEAEALFMLGACSAFIPYLSAHLD